MHGRTFEINDSLETAEIICDDCGQPCDQVFVKNGKDYCWDCIEFCELCNSPVTDENPKCKPE